MSRSWTDNIKEAKYSVTVPYGLNDYARMLGFRRISGPLLKIYDVRNADT